MLSLVLSRGQRPTSQRATGQTPKTHTQQEDETMTNAKIIFEESLKLMKDGKIGTTGRKLTMVAEDGTKTQIDEPEMLHTFAEWKKLGYFVNKGEKAVARFAIWNYTSKPSKRTQALRKAAGVDETADDPHYYMKEAYFFTINQTTAAQKQLPAVI